MTAATASHLLAGVPESFEHPQDRAEFRRPRHRTGVELYRACIVRHAFEPHVHDGFGLGAIRGGVERFRYRGADHLAPAGSVVLMNPDTMHTGQAATDQGWSYRMAYVDADLVAQVSGERGWWFDEAVVHDRAVAARVDALLGALWAAVEPLAFDEALAQLLQALRPLARRSAGGRAEGAVRFAPVIEHLRAHLDQPQTLQRLAALAGLSPFHFLRRFKAQHGATPHQVLMALRLQDAQRRLAAGQPPAAVAAAVGLADQAHLTRAFARRYGVTPGRYQRQLGRG